MHHQDNIIRQLIREMAKSARDQEKQADATPTKPLRTLVVGGDASFVARKITQQLANHGLEVVANWPWDETRRVAPENIEMIFIVTDMAGHKDTDAAQKLARSRGIPIIYGVRKYSHNIKNLVAKGFKAINKSIVLEGESLGDLILYIVPAHVLVRS
jgi:hypothetical protein